MQRLLRPKPFSFACDENGLGCAVTNNRVSCFDVCFKPWLTENTQVAVFVADIKNHNPDRCSFSADSTSKKRNGTPYFARPKHSTFLALSIFFLTNNPEKFNKILEKKKRNKKNEKIFLLKNVKNFETNGLFYIVRERKKRISEREKLCTVDHFRWLLVESIGGR